VSILRLSSSLVRQHSPSCAMRFAHTSGEGRKEKAMNGYFGSLEAQRLVARMTLMLNIARLVCHGEHPSVKHPRREVVARIPRRAAIHHGVNS